MRTRGAQCQCQHFRVSAGYLGVGSLPSPFGVQGGAGAWGVCALAPADEGGCSEDYFAERLPVLRDGNGSADSSRTSSLVMDWLDSSWISWYCSR